MHRVEDGVTLDELQKTIMDSDSTDWKRILAMGPTYRDRFASWTGPGDQAGIDHDSHPEIAVYRPDIDLTIAFGLPESGTSMSVSFDWSENFPDSEISEISIADIFWRGSLVDRVNFVYVDGGRGILPLGGGHQGLRITQYGRAVAYLLDRVTERDEFHRYYDSVPYELQD